MESYRSAMAVNITKKSAAAVSILILIAVLITVFSAAFSAACSPNQDGADERGFITAIGKDIFTAAKGGARTLLTGVNAGGLFLTEDWMCPTALDKDLSKESGQYEYEDALFALYGRDTAEALYQKYRNSWWSEDDYDNIKALGVNTVRLPFGWRDIQNPDYSYRDEPFARLDEFVESCAERGLYVILDLHGAHGSQNGKHHSGDTRTGGMLYTSEENMALTEELWARIAEHFKDNKWIAGYDLLNEPEGVPGGAMSRNSPQWDYYDRLYRAIRAVDPNHMIIMEAVWEINALPDPVEYGWENVAYELHFYLWENSNSLSAQRSFLLTKRFLHAITNYNVPTIIGEFTFFDNAESWEYGLALFNENGWSWTLWTYKVMGENSSWGLYSGANRAESNTVSVLDSPEEIEQKWSKLNTSEYFTANAWLVAVVKKYAADAAA